MTRLATGLATVEELIRFRARLERAERALDAPFRAWRSLAIDRALVELEADG